MIPTTKCLWTLLLTTVITILTEHIIQCTPTFDGQPSSSVENDLADAYAQNDDLKRDWSKFASWGKRGFNNNFSLWGKRGTLNDDQIAQMTPEKKWSKFASWGKRGSVDDLDKRAWSKSFQVWGKRADDGEAKREWAQIAPWGKRDVTGDNEMMDKRKWSKFASWGKRSDGQDDGLDKREWAQLSPTWGKRNLNDEAEPEKREWSKFASWGKRFRPRPWVSALEPWGKRRWTGITTWGKRSGDMENFWSKGVAQKLLALFDSNGECLKYLMLSSTFLI